MSISQPYLAILSTMVFIAVIISVSFIYLYIIDQANRIPVLGVYADSYIDSDTNETVILIVVRHERGRLVEIQRILLFNDSSTIIIDDFDELTMHGCRNREIPAGGKCTIILRFPLGVFYENKTYQGIVYLNEGIYPIAFTPSKWFNIS
jgi:hypothetical protein